MAYAPLGSRRATSVADTTGNNPGNYTTTFGPSELSIMTPVFELYRAVVKGVGIPGSTADIYLDGNEASYNVFGSGAEWDPNQPPLLQPGQAIYFYWSIPVIGQNGAANSPPVVTAWFRYDASMWAKGPT